MGYVAPYVGAWIETSHPFSLISLLESHPTWVRGLKPVLLAQPLLQVVAPYVGAWIETDSP